MAPKPESGTRSDAGLSSMGSGMRFLHEHLSIADKLSSDIVGSAIADVEASLLRLQEAERAVEKARALGPWETIVAALMRIRFRVQTKAAAELVAKRTDLQEHGSKGDPGYPRLHPATAGPGGTPFGLARDESRIRTMSVEHVIVYGPNGYKAEAKGNDQNVTIPKDAPPDSVATHNHPGSGNGYGMSELDVGAAAEWNFKEIRVVVRDGATFSMKRPPGGWPTPKTALLTARAVHKREFELAQRALLKRMKAGQELDFDLENKTLNARRSRETAKALGAPYSESGGQTALVKMRLQEAAPPKTPDYLTQAEIDRQAEAAGFIQQVWMDEFGKALDGGQTAGQQQFFAELGWNLSFALVNRNAILAAQQQAGTAIPGIDALTRARINKVISDGVAAGDSSAVMAAKIRAFGKEMSTPARQRHIKDRADLIAVTELAQAYERGAQMGADYLQKQGIKLEKRWLALNDNRVDQLCRDAMNRGWVPEDTVYGGITTVPPMHPACRCAVSRRWPPGAEGKPDEDWTPVKARFKTSKWQKVQDAIGTVKVGSGHRDPVAAAIAKVQGFDGKPRIMRGDQFLKAEQDGWTRWWRGIDGGKMEAERYATAFKRGDHHVGGGIWGNGTYVATGKYVFEGGYGRAYKKALAPSDSEMTARGFAGPGGKVTTGFLDPAARIIDYTKLERIYKKAVAEYGASFNTATRQRGPGGETLLVSPPYVYSYQLPSVLQDPGRFAAALGYDAIFVPRSDRASAGKLGDQYVILNRTILHILEL